MCLSLPSPPLFLSLLLFSDLKNLPKIPSTPPTFLTAVLYFYYPPKQMFMWERIHF